MRAATSGQSYNFEFIGSASDQIRSEAQTERLNRVPNNSGNNNHVSEIVLAKLDDVMARMALMAATIAAIVNPAGGGSSPAPGTHGGGRRGSMPHAAGEDEYGVFGPQEEDSEGEAGHAAGTALSDSKDGLNKRSPDT